MRTALAGPQGKRHGWQRIKPACATLFLVCFTGNVLIKIAHEPTDIVQTLTVNRHYFF
jgi:hypothetical protein